MNWNGPRAGTLRTMAELQGAGRGAITLAGFNFANVNERVRLAKPSYVSIYETLGKAAKQLEHDQPAVWRVLALLSQLASMALTAATFNEPFAPLLRWNGGRSVGLDDFTDEEIDSLPLIVDAIESSLLKARVLDVLWLRRRNMPSAIAAIDCYLTIELDGLVWAGGGQQCWKRGVQLAATLKTQAGSRVDDAMACLEKRFRDSTVEDGFFPIWIAELRCDYVDNKRDKDLLLQMAEHLAVLATEHKRDDQLDRTRDFLREAQKIYKKVGSQENCDNLTVQIAESYATDASQKEQNPTPSYLLASHFWEKAIHEYRRLPKARRSPAIVERIEALHFHHQSAREASVGELKTVTGASIDISESVAKMRAWFTGVSKQVAVARLASLLPFVDVENLRVEAQTNREQFLFMSLLPQKMLNATDGRVMDRAHSASTDKASGERLEMVRAQNQRIGMLTESLILPALSTMSREHRFAESEFVAIARQSTFVPYGREELVGKALAAGYNWDFVTAIHLLAPQIEHAVRCQLRREGVKTSVLDDQGIEMEVGLSTLIEKPEVARIFGADCVFEIASLFCEQAGPNFRNNLAHGLYADDECASIHAVYAWWLTFKLVVGSTSAVGEQSDTSDSNDAVQATGHHD